MNIVKEIKKNNIPSLKEFFLASFLISQRLSPYISSLYVIKGTKPNKITLHMIYSGILGALLFSLPNIYSKIVGAMLIHLWFILDCSDGEVARYTEQFSKYGKELDFMAHLINHPLFGMSLFFSLAQLDKYNLYYLSLLILFSNLLDYLTRNLNTLYIIINLKSTKASNLSNNSTSWNLKEVLLFISSIFMVYPNFILFGVLFYFVDYTIGTDVLYIYLWMNILVTLIINIRGIVQLVKKFYIN